MQLVSDDYVLCVGHAILSESDKITHIERTELFLCAYRLKDAAAFKIVYSLRSDDDEATLDWKPLPLLPSKDEDFVLDEIRNVQRMTAPGLEIIAIKGPPMKIAEILVDKSWAPVFLSVVNLPTEPSDNEPRN